MFFLYYIWFFGNFREFVSGHFTKFALCLSLCCMQGPVACSETNCRSRPTRRRHNDVFQRHIVLTLIYFHFDVACLMGTKIFITYKHTHQKNQEFATVPEIIIKFCEITNGLNKHRSKSK